MKINNKNNTSQTYATVRENVNVLGNSTWNVQFGRISRSVTRFNGSIPNIVRKNIKSTDPQWDNKKQAILEAVLFNNPPLNSQFEE